MRLHYYKTSLLIILIALFGNLTLNAQIKWSDTIHTSVIAKLEIPESNKSEIISHVGYSFSYNETHEQANWVAYELTKLETVKLYNRTDKFLTDPLVKTSSANDNDYKGFGYDRGHLAPAADMGFSEITMKESFYYSNMSPQLPGFNRGIWKSLEEQVRSWANIYDTIYIVTGPILTEGLKTIGENEVSIPEYYYKVILDYSQPNVKGIAFVLPNASSKNELSSFAISIDSLEKLTNINFYPLLPDKHENLIESKLCITCWDWTIVKTESKVQDSEKKTSSTQCLGTTKAGARCKNKTLNESGYCYLHEEQK
jgi:endonuclease G